MLGLVLVALAAALVSAKQPNIVLILTDDQDKSTLSQRHYLPLINKYLVDEGVLYDNFFAPVSVCCPSRVSLLRTQYAHNHNITFVIKPWGGWDVFNKHGYVGHTLPDYLQGVGYNTYYTGKYMNDHNKDNCESLPVSGFNSSDILVDPYTYDYWNPGFSRDNGPAVLFPGQYSTDLVAERGLDYLDDALKEERPFFLTIAPIASHSWGGVAPNGTMLHDIPAAHPRHARLFRVEQVSRTESFNPDSPQGVSWVKHLPKLNQTQEAYLDEFFRGRLRSLQAVDELVEKVVRRLEEDGQLDNTYIFYTSDNGYALGTHRRQPGKTLGFEEDIHVPLIVRGPGVRKGFRDSLSSYGIVDLSHTILELAGAKTDHVDDGTRINLHQGQPTAQQQLARHSISEYWVLGAEEGVWGGSLRENNTYRTVRVHDEVQGDPVTFSYSVWCTGERELYDLVEDPYQVRNLLAPLNNVGPFAHFGTVRDGQPVLDRRLQKVANRLDALTLVLKTCTGDVCHQPYKAIFPSIEAAGGEIHRLEQALDERFDSYFEGLPKVHFDRCTLGYQSRLEKPDWEPHLAFRSSHGLVLQHF